MAESLRELLIGDWWRYTISLLGTVILVGGVSSLLLDGQLTGEELLQGSALLVTSLALTAIGSQIAVAVREWDQIGRIFGWMSLAVLVSGVIAVWGAVVVQTVETSFEAALLFLTLLTVGALFGAVVGYYDVRVRALVRQAGRERARREFLDEQQETLSTLTGILRHQILNDLSVISGQTQLLASGQVDPERAADPILDHCEQMERTVDRIETLVDILTHTSDASEREIATVIDRASNVARDSNPSLTIETAIDSDRTVRADELLHLAFVELFENSAAHGGGAVSVRVADTDQQLTVEVADEGPGVDVPEDQLFEPNTRGPESDGDGLGLYFARLIVDQYDGEIRLDDSSDGAVFIVELPTAETGKN